MQRKPQENISSSQESEDGPVNPESRAERDEGVLERDKSIFALLPNELMALLVNKLDYYSAINLSGSSCGLRYTLLYKQENQPSLLQRLFYRDIFTATYYAMQAEKYDFCGQFSPDTPRKKTDNGSVNLVELVESSNNIAERVFEAALVGRQALPVFTPLLGMNTELGYLHWVMAFQHIIFNPLLPEEIRLIGIYTLLQLSGEKLGYLSSYFGKALNAQYPHLAEAITVYVEKQYDPYISVSIQRMIIDSDSYYKNTADKSTEDHHVFWKANFSELKEKLKNISDNEAVKSEKKSNRRCYLM